MASQNRTPWGRGVKEKTDTGGRSVARDQMIRDEAKPDLENPGTGISPLTLPQGRLMTPASPLV